MRRWMAWPAPGPTRQMPREQAGGAWGLHGRADVDSTPKLPKVPAWTGPRQLRLGAAGCLSMPINDACELSTRQLAPRRSRTKVIRLGRDEGISLPSLAVQADPFADHGERVAGDHYQFRRIRGREGHGGLGSIGSEHLGPAHDRAVRVRVEVTR